MTPERLAQRLAIATPHDWVEDYEHPDGNYLNACEKCLTVFHGKLRIRCHVCQVEIDRYLPTTAWTKQ